MTEREVLLESENEQLRAKLAEMTADRDMLDKHAKYMLDWRDAQDKTIERLRAEVARLRQSETDLADQLQAERDARGEDWLGLITPHCAYDNDDRATWADLIADLMELDSLDDAQTLYLRIIDMQRQLNTYTAMKASEVNHV